MCGRTGSLDQPARIVVLGAAPADIVLLAVKAAALRSAVTEVAPLVGPATVVVPFLNGMAHLPVLDAVLGSTSRRCTYGSGSACSALADVRATPRHGGAATPAGPPARRRRPPGARPRTAPMPGAPGRAAAAPARRTG